MIEKEQERISIIRQCELLSIPRSSYYYQPIAESELNLLLMKQIDKQYMETPSYGSRMMTAHLNNLGYSINRKRTIRLMRLMGIEAMYPKPRIKTTIPGNQKYPYLLKNKSIQAANEVWGTDITYIPVNGGYFYLVAYIDLFSRYVLSSRLSNSLDSAFCLEALKLAIKKYGIPKIINSDQGVQYTCNEYITFLKNKGVLISMSGKGKCWDNIFVERFWRSLKYEEVYLKQYYDYEEAEEQINNYIYIFNYKRPHSSINYKTPSFAYSNGLVNFTRFIR